MNKNRITISYIAICIITFLITIYIDPKLNIFNLIKFGAKSNFSIVDYKLWYLITPVFLHGSVTHLLLNCLSIYIFGSMVEKYFGEIKFIIITLFLAVVSTIGSFAFSDYVSVGASGVVFGYFSFHIYLFLKNRNQYSRMFGTDVFALIIINLIYTFVGSNIDIYAHLFGLIGGIIIFFTIGGKISIPFQKIIALLLSILVIGSFSWKFINYKNSVDYFAMKYSYYKYFDDTEKMLEIEREYDKLF